MPRYVINHPCRIVLPTRSALLRRRTERSIEGELVDLSVGGASIALRRVGEAEHLAARMTVSVIVGAASVPSRIRHVEHGPGPTRIGVEFLQADVEFQRFVFDLVEQARDADGALRNQWEAAT